ncbi:hypothetical protein AALF15_01205 [Corynebacteriaceae bacterium 7-707]
MDDRVVWAETHPDACPAGHSWAEQGACRPMRTGGEGRSSRRVWECGQCDGTVEDDGVSWPTVPVRVRDLDRTPLARHQQRR